MMRPKAIFRFSLRLLFLLLLCLLAHHEGHTLMAAGEASAPATPHHRDRLTGGSDDGDSAPAFAFALNASSQGASLSRTPRSHNSTGGEGGRTNTRSGAHTASSLHRDTLHFKLRQHAIPCVMGIASARDYYVIALRRILC